MSSPIPSIPGESYLNSQAWQWRFFDLSHKHSYTCNYLWSWHTWKCKQALKNKELNRVAIEHGEKPRHSTSLWQYHSLEAIIEGLLHVVSRPTLRRILDDLQEPHVVVEYEKDKKNKHVLDAEGKPIAKRKGIYGILRVKENMNPNYRFDKRKGYLFLPEKIIAYYKTQVANPVDDTQLIFQKNIEDLNEISNVDNCETKPNNVPQENEFSPKSLISPIGKNFPIDQQKFTNDRKKFSNRSERILQTISNDTKTNDTTNKAAAEPDAAPVVDNTASFTAGQTSCQLAERHFAVMAETRKASLAGRVQQLGSAAEMFTLASWVGGIDLEMQNPDSFSQAKSPTHKLNCILQQAREGRWTPNNVAVEVEQKEAAEKSNARLAMEDKLRKLQLDKVSWEQVIKNPKPYQKDDAYLNSARREVAALNQQIITVQTQLASDVYKENTH